MTLLLNQLAQDAGYDVVERTNGHLQVIGGTYLVNWYPGSRNKTAYINGMTRGFKDCDEYNVIIMATKGCAIYGESADRNYYRARRWREAQYKRLGNSWSCHWCQCNLNRVVDSPQQATTDHKIPLAKGGLDNTNNYVLSCLKCNTLKGNSMPHNSI